MIVDESGGWTGAHAFLRCSGGVLEMHTEHLSDPLAIFPELRDDLAAFARDGSIVEGTLLALDVDGRPDPGLLRRGVEYLLFILLIVWVADGGAYFAGKAFGRVKLAPAISPGKTWEGVVGGFALVTLLAVAVAVWRDVSIGVLVPFCLAVAAISIVGDLTVSMFKRTAGVKDSGLLFPGHGGVLDRVDSVAAASPLFALGLQVLGIV